MAKAVVLTGASSGLGRAAALCLARRGYRLLLVARNEEALRETARLCGSAAQDVRVFPADVCVEEEVKAAAAEAVARFGTVDAWVNNAGTTLFAPLEMGDFAGHRRVIETNLFGAIFGARAILPVFRAQGHGILVNVGSVLSSVGQSLVPAYVISKFGLRGLSEALRVELADAPRIQVCTLLPYAIATPHFENGANWVEQKAHPLSPVQEPHEVAAALADLIERPRRVRYVPRIAALGVALHACFPRAAERTLFEALQRWHVGEGDAATDGNLYVPARGIGAIHGHRAALVSSVRLVAWAAQRMIFHGIRGLAGHA